MARFGVLASIAAAALTIFVAFQLSLTFLVPDTVSLFSFSSLLSKDAATADADFLLGVAKADITG